ncbi:hypothetical protein GCM10029992_33620 [Glycomyces albus]
MPSSKRLRATLVALAAAAVAAAMTLIPRIAADAQEGASPMQIEALSEFDGADCDVPPGSPGSNSQLPDPFTSIDGTPITSVSQWECRRAEIKELAESAVYGDKPAPPDSVTGSVSSSNITVNVTDNGQSTSFSASVQTPGGAGPHPAVIVYGGFGADTDAILGAGAAVVNFDPGSVGAEGTGRSNKQGAFYDLYGSNSSTGILMAQAWGSAASSTSSSPRAGTS